jgi:hypothetical protein
VGVHIDPAVIVDGTWMQNDCDKSQASYFGEMIQRHPKFFRSMIGHRDVSSQPPISPIAQLYEQSNIERENSRLLDYVLLAGVALLSPSSKKLWIKW